MRIDSSDKKKTLKINIIKSGLWYSFGNILTMLLSLVKLYIMAKVFNPKDYGVYSITLMIITLVQSFTVVGARDYLIKEVCPNERTVVTAFTLDWIRGLFACLVVLVLAMPISNIYDETQLFDYLLIVSLSFLFMAFRNINIYKLYSEFKGKKTFIVMQLPIIITNVLIIIFAVTYKNILLIVILNVMTEAIITLLSYVYDFKKPKLKIYKPELKKQFSFASHLYLMSVLGYALRQIDYYFVSYFLGLEVLALYTLAFRIMNIVIDSILPAVINIFYPLISKSTDLKRKEYIRYLVNGILGFYILFGINIYLYMENLIVFIFGDKWSGLYELLLLFIFYSAIRAILSVLGLNLKVNNKMKYENYTSIIEMIIIILIIYPLALRFGLFGVGIAISIALFVRFIIISIITYRKFNINIIRIVMKRYIVAFLLVSVLINYIVLHFININTIFTTLLAIIINLATVAIISFICFFILNIKNYRKYFGV